MEPEPTTPPAPPELAPSPQDDARAKRNEHLRELIATWFAEFSVLIAVFPLLDYVMGERDHDSSLKKIVAVMSLPVAVAFLGLAAYIRVGSLPMWLLRSRTKGS